MIAVLFLNVVNSGLIASGVNPYYSDVITGASLVVSVALEQLTQERNDRARRAVALAEMASGDGDPGGGRGGSGSPDRAVRRAATGLLAPWRDR
jgi:hypothetical protein